MKIDCRAFQERLNDYLDSLMDEEMRRAMEAHARACPECGERLETMTRLLTMCAEMDEGLTPPLEAQAAWRRAVRQEAEGRARAKKPSAWMRGAGAVAAAVVLLFGATALYRSQSAISPIGQVSLNETIPEDTQAQNTAMYAPGASATAGRTVLTRADGPVEETSEIDPSASSDAADTTTGTADTVLLRSASRTMNSPTFDQTMESIEGLVDDFEGRVQTRTVRGAALSEGGEGRSASLTARVPAASLDDFLRSLDSLASVSVRTETSEDISTQYYDADARLSAYRTQLTRLGELTKTAASLQDLVLLEEKTNETQAQIDSLEGQVRAWRAELNEATVDIVLEETASGQAQPAADASDLGARARSAFAASLDWLKSFMQDAAVVLAGMAPQLIVVIPVVVVVWVIVHCARKRRRARK